MNLDWENVWQVASGDGTRDYSQFFLDYGLIAVGATWDKGPYDEKLRPYTKKEQPEDDSPGKIWPVAVGMNNGDTVLLKRGKTIVAIGKIISDYLYDGNENWADQWSTELEEKEVYISPSDTRLDDIEGWDLRHTRLVQWWVSNSPVQCNQLTRATVNAVKSEDVILTAKSFLKKAKLHKSSLVLPEPARILSNEDVIDHLMTYGLSSQKSEELAARLKGLQRLAAWYERESSVVSEHEIRAYLVWPLLQVLGWSEQCVKFEYKYKDIIIYHKPLTADEKNTQPFIIGETKGMFFGLSPALEQVKRYASELSAEAVLVTDGVRYYLETLGKSKIKAYMNILRLRDRHPYYENIDGAPKLLSYLIKG